jgi:predicted nucleotidyltransferase
VASHGVFWRWRINGAIDTARARRYYSDTDEMNDNKAWPFLSLPGCHMHSNAKADVEARRNTWLAKLNAELDRMLDLLKARSDVEQVILFGSLSRKQAGARSDLDLIIIQKTNKRFLDRLGEFYSYLGPKVATDILVYTPEEWKTLPQTRCFFNKLQQEGVLLYDTQRP